MINLTKVEKGIRVSFPLKKNGWGFIKPKENGIIVTQGDQGLFISENELNKLGYSFVNTEMP